MYFLLIFGSSTIMEYSHRTGVWNGVRRLRTDECATRDEPLDSIKCKNQEFIRLVIWFTMLSAEDELRATMRRDWHWTG